MFNILLFFLAYEVLSDSDKRKQYDMYGESAFNANGGGGHSGGFRDFNFDDFFKGFDDAFKFHSDQHTNSHFNFHSDGARAGGGFKFDFDDLFSDFDDDENGFFGGFNFDFGDDHDDFMRSHQRRHAQNHKRAQAHHQKYQAGSNGKHFNGHHMPNVHTMHRSASSFSSNGNKINLLSN